MSEETSKAFRITNVVSVVIFAGLVGGALYVLSGSGEFPLKPSGKASTVANNQPEMRSRLYVGVRTKDGGDQLYEISPSSTPRLVETPEGWQAERLQGASEVRLEQRGTDGFSVMADEGWNVLLRSPNGRLYEAPRLVGLLDAEHALVVARGESLEALSVAKNGSLKTLTPLPDTSGAFAVGAKAFWYATYVQGEGLESEPLGPSELRRVDERGASSFVTASSVIESILPGAGGGVAYAMASAFVVVFPDKGEWRGVGHPLLWLDDERVLYANQGSIRVVQRGQAEETILADVGGQPVSAAQITDMGASPVLH